MDKIPSVQLSVTTFSAVCCKFICNLIFYFLHVESRLTPANVGSFFFARNVLRRIPKISPQHRDSKKQTYIKVI